MLLETGEDDPSTLFLLVATREDESTMLIAQFGNLEVDSLMELEQLERTEDFPMV